jgi:protein gp37
MSATTGIEWTQATWNPWLGCAKVSPGCAHCYMFREQRRYGRDPEVVVRSKTTFGDPLKWSEGRLVFTCSWSDWFHPDADAWRDEAWDIIRRTPQHTYQILTKRTELIADRLPKDWGRGYPNVWLGTSIEGQRYDYRAAELCQFPAAVHFISAEPLLASLDLRFVNPYRDPSERRAAYRHPNFLGIDVLAWPKRPPLFYTPGAMAGRIDWVIVGGESGAGARDMLLPWVRTLRDQCLEADVAFFLKQLGGAGDPRAHAAAVLDGVRHVQMPTSVVPA